MEIGGFDEGLEVRENSHLIKRLLQFGKYRYIGDVAATTSNAPLPILWFPAGDMALVKNCGSNLFFCDLHRRHYET